MANQMVAKESKDRRGKTPVTKVAKKEDGNPERLRRKSADKEGENEEAMTQGGRDLSESGDGDDGKGGGGCL